MKFEIGDVVGQPAYSSAFLVKVKLMHGDAKTYTEHEMHIPKSELPYLEQAVGLLRDMLDLPWNEARKAYSSMPLFKVWFGSEFLGAMDGLPALDNQWPVEATYGEWDKIKEMSFDWKRDVTYTDINARLDKFEVFYYDEVGRLRKVNVSE